MNLLRIATRIIINTILEEIRDSCPSQLHENIGKLIGSGYYGEVYEIDDKVLKIGIAKTKSDADIMISKLQRLQSLNSILFAQIFDYGILCDIDLPNSKYMIKSGVAYFYLMEHLIPISSNDIKIISRTLNDLEDLSRKPNYEQLKKKYLWSKSRQYKRDGGIEDVDPLIKAASLWDNMISSNLSHRDMHQKNIMQNENGDYKFVDLESMNFVN